MSTETAITRPTDGPIHTWFGLTYSNYLVLPRALLQSMPTEFQERLVACLRELDDAFGHIEQAAGYEVHAATEHEICDLTEDQLAERGITEHWYDDDEPTGLDAADLTEWQAAHELPDAPVYRDANGAEINAGDSVLIRCDDPVPHYRHAYIQPRTPASPTPA